MALMALCGALRRRWSPVTPRHFARQAWRLVTSTFISRGRRGAISHPPSFHVAGVAQSHIHLRFAWQAWHNLTSTFILWGRRGAYGTVWRASSPLVAGDVAAFYVAGVVLGASTFVSRGRRGTISHPPSFCVAGVAQSHIHLRFAWQAWHLWNCVARLVAVDPAVLCVAGVALEDIHLRFA